GVDAAAWAWYSATTRVSSASASARVGAASPTLGTAGSPSGVIGSLVAQPTAPASANIANLLIMVIPFFRKSHRRAARVADRVRGAPRSAFATDMRRGERPGAGRTLARCERTVPDGGASRDDSPITPAGCRVGLRLRRHAAIPRFLGAASSQA